MATKSFVRTRPGQRVDQPDFERASDTSTRDVVEQIGEHFLTGLDTGRHYVLEGLITTNPTGTTLQVTGGKAIVGYRDRGEIRYGSLLTSGATSRSIDVSAFTNGAYTVYVCLSLGDNEYGNRAFWDATLGTPAEVTRNVPTRRVENWSIAVETTSPGAEWIPVATFTKSGASLTGLTDVRELYFEGQAANSYAVLDPEWGTSNDRHADRSTYGIRSLRKFVRAVQRQISSIIGGTGWWSAIPAGSDLTSLLANKLARNGSQPMTGNLLPDVNNTRDLGAAGTRWNEIFGTSGIFDDLTVGSSGGVLASVGFLPTGANGRSVLIRGTATVVGVDQFRIIYQNSSVGLAGSPAIEVAVNASWDFNTPAGGYRWTSANTATESFLYVNSATGLYVYRRPPSAGAWLDVSGPTGWTLIHAMTNSGTVFFTTVDTTSTSLNAGALSAGAMTGTTLNLSGAYTGTTAALTGQMTSNTALVLNTATAARLTLSTAAPATPAVATTYSNMLVVARGTIVTDGAGAVAVSSTSPSTSVNIATGTTTGNNVRVTFTTPPATGGSYQVLISCRNPDAVAYVVAVNLTYFDFGTFDSSLGTTFSAHSNGSPLTFDFIVVGG